MDIGAVLKKLREKNGATVDEISVYLANNGKKSAPKTIYGWEKNRSEPDSETLMLLCRYYNVTDILSEFGYGNNDCADVKSQESLSKLEREVILDFRRLNDEGQQHLRNTLADMIAGGRYEPDEYLKEGVA